MTNPKTRETELGLLFRATSFAALKHKDQRRKDRATPYINHPITVAENLITIGGITDIDTIVAAILHDTIEDTDATGDELEEHFGSIVRAIVEEVTDDKSLPKAVRKQLQIDHAPHKSDAAKCLKLADKIANVSDILTNPPTEWSEKRKGEYVDWATRVVEGLRGINKPLEDHFDDLGKQFLEIDGSADQ